MIFAAQPNGLHHVPAAAMRKAFAMVREQDRFSAPLMLAAASGEIDCITINDPRAAWPAAYLRKAALPVVVLLGDDPGNPAGQGGPSAWRCTAPAAAWVAGAVIHGAGGQPEHYAEAVIGALAIRRVLLIETTSAHARNWHKVIGCPRTLLLIAQDGHPIDARVVH